MGSATGISKLDNCYYKFNSHATCFNCCSRLYKRQLWRGNSNAELHQTCTLWSPDEWAFLTIFPVLLVAGEKLFVPQSGEKDVWSSIARKLLCQHWTNSCSVWSIPVYIAGKLFLGRGEDILGDKRLRLQGIEWFWLCYIFWWGINLINVRNIKICAALSLTSRTYNWETFLPISFIFAPKHPLSRTTPYFFLFFIDAIFVTTVVDLYA